MASKSRRIALGGIMGALCILSLYLAAYLPTSRLFFYGISSVFCGVMVMEAGIKWAWVFYGATALLSIILIPDKIRAMPYIFFFGVYGIIKYYIESLKNITLELILKGLFFILSTGASAYIFKELLIAGISPKLPLWAVGAGAIVVFYIYDYAFSRFASYYIMKIKGKR